MPTTHGHTMLFVIDCGHSGPYPACLTQVASSSSSGNLYLSNDQSKRKKGGMGGRRSFLLHSPGTLILLYFLLKKHKTFEVEIISLEKEREKITFHSK